MTTNEDEEAARVARAQAGEAEAIAELARRSWRAARAAAYAVTGELASAEDAAADGLVAALTHLGDLRDPNRFGPWLRTIVVREARRRSAPARAPEDQREPAARDEPARLEQRETAALLREAVERLPEALREAVALHYFEGYPVAEAARLLEVPVGTLKRRLHDARARLRDEAEAILAGRRPDPARRTDALARIEALLREGEERGDAGVLHAALREALELRPVPPDLLGRWLRAHPHVAPALASGAGRSGLEQMMRVGLERFGGPSARAADPAHAVGAVAVAIRAALPTTFAPWELDPAEAARAFVQRVAPGGDPTRVSVPPGFLAGRPCAYVRATRGLLMTRPDGSVAQAAELVRASEGPDSLGAAIVLGARLSDVLDLAWMETRPLELQEVEALLRRLVRDVLGEREVRVAAHREPRYRAGLRLELSDQAAPAAIGGVLAPWPGMREGTDAVHVRLHLEPWAAGRSGVAVELEPFDALMSDAAPLAEDELRGQAEALLREMFGQGAAEEGSDAAGEDGSEP